MENKKPKTEILKEIEDKQPQLRSEFWTEINEILRNDSSQSVNNSKGTKIRLTRDGIIIECGISAYTLKKLINTKYLIHCTEEGRVYIDDIVLRDGGEQWSSQTESTGTTTAMGKQF